MRIRFFLKSFLIVLALLFSLQGLAHPPISSSAGDDEVLPWPWGTECPFPWHSIEGEWVVDDAPGTEVLSDHFKFRVLNRGEEGSYYFEMLRFNSEGLLLARGRGVSPDHLRVIRAAMIEVDENGYSTGKSYWAIVRAYERDKGDSCGTELATVITLRPISGQQSEDIHLIIEKVGHSDNQR